MPAPLDGLTVIDLSTSVSGPFAGGMLAEYGARVIKVEAPDMVDVARFTGTARNGVTAMYASINRGKEATILDLKTAEGKAARWALLDKAEVLLQNSRPGALAKLGFDWDTVHVRCPQLIYASITGFGQTGPLARARVYDQIIQVAAGIADSQINPISGGPMLYQGILCDKVTSLHMSQAIMAGLLARERGLSEGQKIDIAMLDAAVHFHWCDGMYNFTFLEEGGVDRAPEFGMFYRLAHVGDDYVTLCLMSDSELKGAIKAMSLDHMLEDERFATAPARLKNHKAMGDMFKARFEEMGFEELMKQLYAQEVPAGAVIRRGDLATFPQIQENGTIVEVEHPVAGRMHAARPPAKLSATPLSLREPAPARGEHDAALAAEFGYQPLEATA
ncbi:MAG: CaiB/BaiF CoA transferase family protein [Sphingomonadales bacterium]